jgi:hypothetical protein
MVWLKRTRLTLLIGLLVAGAALAWLAAHPQLYAGQLGRLVTRNLLQDTGATLSFADLRGNPLEGMTFYEVVLVRSGARGEFLYVDADSLQVSYDPRVLLRGEPVLRELAVGGAQIVIRGGEEPPEAEAEDEPHPWTTIDALPRFDVGRVRLDQVGLEVTAADGSVVSQVRDVHADLSARSDGTELSGFVRSLRGHWPTQGIRVHTAHGDAAFAPPTLRCEDFHVEMDSTRATVDLSLAFDAAGDAELSVAGEAEDFLLSELLRLIVQDDAEVPRLRLQGEAEVRLRDDRLRIDGSGRGWLDDAPVAARRFVGVIEEDRFVFEEVDGRYRSVNGTARGELLTDRDPPRLQLRGDVRGVDLADPWTGEDLGWPRSALATTADFRLDIADEDTAVEIEARSLRGEVAGLPVADGRVRIRYSAAEGLLVDEAVVNSQGALLEAYGEVSPDEVVDLFLDGQADSIDAWAREVGLPITGQTFVGSGRLIGPVESLMLDVAGKIEAVQWGALEAERGNVRVRIPAVDVPDRLLARLEASRLRATGTDLGALDVELEREGTVNRIPRLELSVSDSTLRLAGRVIEEPDGETFRVEVDSMEADLGGEIWSLAEPASARVRETGFDTAGIELTSATGRFRFEGRAERGETLDLGLQVLDGDLSILDRVGLLDGIDGDVRGELRLTGTNEFPELEAEVAVDSLRVAGRRIAGVELRGTARGRDVTIDDLRVRSTEGEAHVEGAITLPFDRWLAWLEENPGDVAVLWNEADLDVRVDSRRLDLAHWLDPAAESGTLGRSDVDLSLAGPTVEPRIEGTVEVVDFPAEPFVLPWMQGRVVVDSTGTRVTEGRVDLGGPDAMVTAHLPVYVSLTGPSRYEPDEGLDLTIDSGPNLDLSTLDALWPQVRSISGRGRLALRARGHPDRPEFTGDLVIRNGSFALEGWSEELREVEVDGDLQGRRLRLERLEAREGLNGRIRGTGEVVFDGLLPDDVTLDLDAERVLIATVPSLRAIGTSDDLRLTIERPAPDSPRAPKITGTVVVDKAIYTGEFAAATEGEPDPALLPTRAPEWLADLRIRAQDQVRISNQSAELRVAGDVSLIRDLEGLRLRGEVQIPQGQVPLFNNDFTITEGTLDFSRRPVEPEVDIRAETEVPISDPTGQFGRELERITVHLTGTFARPQVRFESESGLDETSILRLLAGFGSASTSNGATGLGDVGLRAGLNFLERALANRIRGIDTIDIETEEAGLADMQSTRIAVGKYLSQSLYLRFSQGLSVTERDLFVEYQISRRTLFTSELKRRLRETGAENEFNVDLKFRVKY